jgi:hypothetical protein
MKEKKSPTSPRNLLGHVSSILVGGISNSVHSFALIALFIRSAVKYGKTGVHFRLTALVEPFIAYVRLLFHLPPTDYALWLVQLYSITSFPDLATLQIRRSPRTGIQSNLYRVDDDMMIYRRFMLIDGTMVVLSVLWLCCTAVRTYITRLTAQKVTSYNLILLVSVNGFDGQPMARVPYPHHTS